MIYVREIEFQQTSGDVDSKDYLKSKHSEVSKLKP